MPLSGMTGFGRAEGACRDWTWSVEARSVNGRNLEVRFRGPPGVEGRERVTREAAQSRFQRGQLTVGVQAKRLEGLGAIRINLEVLDRYLAAGDAYLASGRAAPPALDGLLALRGVIEADTGAEDPEALAEVEQAMAASIAQALDGLAAMRRVEGASLLGVLNGSAERIAELTRAADRLAADQPGAIRDRFARRLTELVGETASEDRIRQEAAVMAVKADVREELDRLAGHVEAAKTLLASDGGVGRKLDFLTQEFMREANTLCSKSALPGLTTVGLDLKATIEQFREQVQNVE